MKQTLLSIVLLLLMVFVTSGYTRDNDGLEIGDFAPEISASAKDGSVSLNSLRGNFVLVSFWSSSDAQSRIRANENDAWAKANASEGWKAIGVNFDEESALFNEISLRDGLDAQSQINVQGEQARKIKKDFRLENGYGAMLIGPDGRIIAVNPSSSSLDEYKRGKMN
ncbi:MAG: redoxin domain-containing protein [Clostridium sp.]|nr:redoxin domain-containing protein [Clostridium sp.]